MVAAWGGNGTAEMGLGRAQYGPNCLVHKDSLWLSLPNSDAVIPHWYMETDYGRA